VVEVLMARPRSLKTEPYYFETFASGVEAKNISGAF